MAVRVGRHSLRPLVLTLTGGLLVSGAAVAGANGNYSKTDPHDDLSPWARNAGGYYVYWDPGNSIWYTTPVNTPDVANATYASSTPDVQSPWQNLGGGNPPPTVSQT